MRLEELRISNLMRLLRNDKIAAVTGLTENNKIWFVDNPKYLVCAFDIEGIKPIPLTEEWLKKFGFVDFKLNGFHVDLETNDVIIDFKQGQQLSGVLIENIKYVHQLQNLYFTLTGEEL